MTINEYLANQVCDKEIIRTLDGGVIECLGYYYYSEPFDDNDKPYRSRSYSIEIPVAEFFYLVDQDKLDEYLTEADVKCFDEDVDADFIVNDLITAKYNVATIKGHTFLIN